MSEKELENMKKRKAEMNPVVLDWNWRYQRELNSQYLQLLIEINIDVGVQVYMCIYSIW